MNPNLQQHGNLQLPPGINPAAFLNGNTNGAAPHFNVPHLQQLTNFHHRQQAHLAQHHRQTNHPALQAVPPNVQQPNVQQNMMAMQTFPPVQQQFQQSIQQQPIRNSQQSRQETLQQLIAAQNRGIRPPLTMPQVAPASQQDPRHRSVISKQKSITPQANPGAGPPPPVATQPMPNSQMTTIPSMPTTNSPEPPGRAPSSAPVRFLPISEAFTPPSGRIPSPTKIKPEFPVFDPSAALKAKRPRKRDSDGSTTAPRARNRAPKSKPAEPLVFFAGVEQPVVKDSPSLAAVAGYRSDTRHDARHAEALLADARRRKEEGLRGQMRNESESPGECVYDELIGQVARLMYGAGDTSEPAVDSVEVMEDMVGDFLADLCRPSPSIRTTRDAPYQLVPLSASIVRHRLASRASMKKYLERFDTMAYKTEELASARRVAALAESHHDLVETVGRSYLGIEDQGQAPARGPMGRPRKHRPDEDGDVAETGSRRRGRLPKEPNDTGERKKPGPAKGWKNALPVDDPRRGKKSFKPRRFGMTAKKESSVKVELKTEPEF